MSRRLSVIRIGTRRATAVGAAVAALATVTVLSGCGAGQVSQVATQVPAIDGNSTTVGTNPRIAVRNVYLHMVTPESGSIAAGTPVPLIFTAVNESPVRKATDPADLYPQPLKDELVSITSDFGAVALTSAASPMTIKPGQSLVVGDAKGAEELAKVPGSSVTQATAVFTPNQDIHNGVTYPMVFTFKDAGAAPINVPISAGEGSGHSEHH
jgi:hypothetical protein